MKHQHSLKPVYVCVLMALAAQPAAANPYGASVINGQVSFATAGNTLTVTNTPGAIINWQGFSIGANEITRFAQQSASSAVLNRVISGNPSSILGSLLSNGRVYLVNPNGIVFGVGSTINVAGLVATTINISNADFLAGRDNFTQVPGAQNISNAGNITAQQGGQIFLIAPNVENTGVITAPNGEILLAAGHSVELVNSNEPSLRVSITAPAGDATNVGQLVASAGNLGLFGAVVRNSGIVSADSATMQGGKIVLKASQLVEAGGKISAQGVGGGEIKLLADMQNGTVDVNAVLEANAPSAGNGGFIETSAAHVHVEDTAYISTAAQFGKAGTWLIDPQDFTIAASGGDITGAALSTALDSTGVLIQSISGAVAGNGDIFVSDNITKTATGVGATTLTLQAESSIILSSNTSISSSGDALNVVFNADTDGLNGGAIVMNSGSSITSNGGNITLGGGVAGNGTGNAVGNATYIDGIYLDNATLDAAGGNIAMNGTGVAGVSSANGIYVTNASHIQTSSAGTITLNGMGGAGVSDNNGIRIGTNSVINSVNGAIALIGQGGASTGFNNMGVYVHNNATIGATGTGSLTLNGTGGSVGTAGGSNRGVRVSNAQISSDGVGGIDIFGQGGYDGDGVQIVNAAVVQSTSGSVNIAGTSGDGPGNDHGIYIGGSSSGATIQSAGNITLTGISLAVSDANNYGVFLDWGTINSTGGNLNMNGTSQPGASNYGINIWDVVDAAGTTTLNSDRNILIQASQNPTSNMVLRADMNGTGVGTVIFSGTSITNAFGKRTDLYYNPVSYTDAGTKSDTSGNPYSANLLGDGANTAWMLVNTLANLQDLGTNLAGNYALGKDIAAYAATPSITFSGQFNGQNHTITGLTSSLFGSIDVGAAVSNVGLVGSALSGTSTSNIGAMAGTNYGTISNSYLSGGSVSGSTNVGGLVGSNYGSIDNSYVAGVGVTGWANVGGLAGLNQGGSGGSGGAGMTSAPGTPGAAGSNATISNSYVSGGSVSGYSNVGGLVGLNAGGAGGAGGSGTSITAVGGAGGAGGSATISNSYVDGGTVVSGNFMVGGLVGSNASGATGSMGTGLYGGLGGTGGTAAIGNSYVSGGSISGSTNVGGLVGSNYASISNSYVSGGSVSGWNNVGGLAGLNQGGAGGSGGAGMTSATGTLGVSGSNATISGSYVSGGLVSGYSNVGGLVGLNAGGAGGAGGSGTSITALGGAGGAGGSATISNSYVDGGTVVSGNFKVGGMVGSNASGATGSMGTGLYGGMGGAGGVAAIGNSYVSGGMVTGTNTWTGTVGGLAGYNSGTISNTYVTGGTVMSAAGDSGWVGGLVGNNLGTIMTSYASTGVVDPVGYYGFGGLVGGNTGSVTDSFWDVDTSGQTLGIGDYTAGATGVYSSTPTVDAFTQATYTGFDFGNTWWMSDGNTRPFLRSEWNNNIINSHQLQLMGMDLSASYTLATNIDMTETASLSGMWGGGGFVPVSYYTSYLNYDPFIGQFDGQYFTISNLTINRPAESYVGLFGFSGGALRNVGLLNVTVNGGSSTGALAGYSYGSITNSYADNSASGGGVTGINRVGGLVGENSGTLSDSYVFNVSVNGGNQVGGLAGDNSGTISNSYVHGGNGNGGSSVVASGDAVGGLVGQNRGTINRSSVIYGIVSGYGDVGGLVGYGDYMGSVITNSFVDSSMVTGVTSNAGGLVGFDSGEGTIANSYVTNSWVSGNISVGGLVGALGSCSWNCGSGISNSYVSSSGINGSGNNVGGLVGHNMGDINGSYVDFGVSVIGHNNVGGLVGANVTTSDGGNMGGTISNSYVNNGWVTSTGSDEALNAGGLVGYNSGSVSNSWVSGGTVSASSSGWNVGGLVGYNSSSGTISNSYVDGGTVSGSSLSTIGGLVGLNVGSISNSYVTNGIVNGNSNEAGGLVGHNTGSISNSYVSGGSVSGTWAVGGLVGSNDGSISNSYVTNGTVVNGSYNVGGLVGHNQGGWATTYYTTSSGSIINSYVDNGTVVNGSYNIGGLVGYNQVATPWNSAGIISNSHYNVNDVWINDSNAVTLGGLYNDVLNVNSVGQYDDWFNGGLLTPLSIANYSTLSGSAGNYAIGTADGMKDMLGFADAGYSFTLANNITLPSGYNIPYLVGNFDGGGFTIDGLDVNLPNSMMGLFNHVSAGSTVNNVVLGTSYVTGWDTVGALAGLNEGTISNSHAANVTVSGVSGGSQIGGLVGSNDGAISNSYVSGGSVSGNYLVGGLVGYNTGSVSNNSYVDGIGVSGWSRVGGLVGGNYGGSISNSYASNATVEGGFDVGGLVGVSYGGSSIDSSHVSGGVVNDSGSNAGGLVGYNGGNISNSYVDMSASGSVTAMWDVGGLVGYNDGGEGGGNISNSYVKGGVVTATAAESYVYAGGLVGYNGVNGSISNSYVRDNTVTNGTNSSQARIGGLVGDNAGSISNSYVSNGTVDGNGASGTGRAVGGLVGFNSVSGSISNSYFSGGIVKGDWAVGGLVGQNSGNISNSYASTSSIAGSGDVGGLVGYDSGEGVVANNFWDAAMAGGSLTNGIGYAYSYPMWGPSDVGATPLSSIQMKTMANFTNAGWDIANTGGAGKVWRIYEGQTTPLLTSFLKPLTVTANNDNKTNDGLPYSGGNGVTYSDGNAPLSGAVLGTLAYGGTSQGAVNSGNYTISPTGLYSDQQGYDISFVNGALTVLGTPSDVPLDIYQLIHLPDIDFTSGLPSVTMSSVNLMFALNPSAAGGTDNNEEEHDNRNNVCQ